MFISSPVSKLQMSVSQPRDASSKGWTERDRQKTWSSYKDKGRKMEIWQKQEQRDVPCYIKHKEGRPHFTRSGPVTWKIHFQSNKPITKSAEICSKWNKNTCLFLCWRPHSLGHVTVLWVVSLLMCVKYFTAKSDPKWQHHKNDPGLFRKPIEEKTIHWNISHLFLTIYRSANTTLSINKTCCTARCSPLFTIHD